MFWIIIPSILSRYRLKIFGLLIWLLTKAKFKRKFNQTMVLQIVRFLSFKMLSKIKQFRIWQDIIKYTASFVSDERILSTWFITFQLLKVCHVVNCSPFERIMKKDVDSWLSLFPPFRMNNYRFKICRYDHTIARILTHIEFNSIHTSHSVTDNQVSWGSHAKINPYLPSGLFHPIYLTSPFPVIGCLVYFFFFILFLIEIRVSKRWRP